MSGHVVWASRPMKKLCLNSLSNESGTNKKWERKSVREWMKNLSAINTQDLICIPCSTEITYSSQKTATNLYNYNLQLCIFLLIGCFHHLFILPKEPSHFLSVHVSWLFRSVNVGVNKPFIPPSTANFLIYIQSWEHEPLHIFLDV